VSKKSHGSGYLGKILWVDLSYAKTWEERLDDDIYERFVGGYGLAAKVIFDQQPARLPVFDPGNIVAVMSGLLTNGRGLFNGRWMLAGKSPLTGTWGDSNCGGNFAPTIKGAGYDGIFIKGASERPVYLLVDGDRGHVSIEDASDLWGQRDAVETEQVLNCRHGQDFRTIAIGVGGEHRSLISGVVNDRGRLAGRSGFGAVFGAKKLKAICARGTRPVPVHDQDLVWQHSQGLLTDLVENLGEFGQTMKNTGTAGTLTDSAESGDAPIKNWLGVGAQDFPKDKADDINGFSVTAHEVEKYYCHGCPFGCGGICQVRDHLRSYETHRPEYETLCGFGAQLLNHNLDSIFAVNEMCNRAGIDTISCATTLDWVFDAFNRGLIDEAITGMRLKWGDHKAVVELVRQIVENRDFGGRYLKDGLREAVRRLFSASGMITDPEKIAEAESCAMHVHGQELPMHDSRLKEGGLGLGVGYEVEPTPGRHTSTFPGIDAYTKPAAVKDSENSATLRTNPRARTHKFQSRYLRDPDQPLEQLGEDLRDASCAEDVINALGLCNFAFYLGPNPPFVEWANATTGWALTLHQYLEVGRRIKTIRHAFNIREGIDVAQVRMPERARGAPPMKHGPSAYSANVLMWDDAKQAYYRAMGWDPVTAKPLEDTLRGLLLPEVRDLLYP
jgi:aldehyde:ferredoxin oxidoreductase